MKITGQMCSGGSEQPEINETEFFPLTGLRCLLLRDTENKKLRFCIFVAAFIVGIRIQCLVSN